MKGLNLYNQDNTRNIQGREKNSFLNKDIEISSKKEDVKLSKKEDTEINKEKLFYIFENALKKQNKKLCKFENLESVLRLLEVILKSLTIDKSQEELSVKNNIEVISFLKDIFDEVDINIKNEVDKDKQEKDLEHKDKIKNNKIIKGGVKEENEENSKKLRSLIDNIEEESSKFIDTSEKKESTFQKNEKTKKTKEKQKEEKILNNGNESFIQKRENLVKNLFNNLKDDEKVKGKDSARKDQKINYEDIKIDTPYIEKANQMFKQKKNREMSFSEKLAVRLSEEEQKIIKILNNQNISLKMFFKNELNGIKNKFHIEDENGLSKYIMKYNLVNANDARKDNLTGNMIVTNIRKLLVMQATLFILTKSKEDRIKKKDEIVQLLNSIPKGIRNIVDIEKNVTPVFEKMISNASFNKIVNKKDIQLGKILLSS